MATFRSLRLTVHLGKHESAYSLILRDAGGKTTFDRRLSSGSLKQREHPSEPRDVLDLLQRVIHDLQRRHQAPARPQAPGAPGGGGEEPPSDPEATIPMFVISRDGQTLDFDGNPV